MLIAVLTGLGLVVGFLTYRTQQRKKRLEYIVISNTSVVPDEVSNHLSVTYNGKPVKNAAVAVIRIVNTGNIEIKPGDFISDIKILMKDTKKIVSALSTKVRPIDLNPNVEIKENSIHIKPTLINAEDMVELQVLTSNIASEISVGGRLSGVKISSRKELPYPPGSDTEGELLPGDKIFWYGFSPLFIAVIVVSIVNGIKDTLPDYSIPISIIFAVIYVLVLNPIYVRYLIKRRRLWRP